MLNRKDQLLAALADSDNATGIFTKSEVLEVAELLVSVNQCGFSRVPKVGRNQFNPSMVGQVVQMPSAKPQKIVPMETIQSQPPSAKILTQAKLSVEVDNLVPQKDETYVPFGFYTDLTRIVKSGMFYPVFICGLSGNGKTMMAEQIAARQKRERFVSTFRLRPMKMI